MGVSVETGTGGTVGLAARVGAFEPDGPDGGVGMTVAAGLGGTVSPGQKMVSGGID